MLSGWSSAPWRAADLDPIARLELPFDEQDNPGEHSERDQRDDMDAAPSVIRLEWERLANDRWRISSPDLPGLRIDGPRRELAVGDAVNVVREHFGRTFRLRRPLCASSRRIGTNWQTRPTPWTPSTASTKAHRDDVGYPDLTGAPDA
jgi:hypothetical protein